MKKINLVTVVIYFLLAVYYAIFNWSVFIVELNVDFGFSVINMPIIAFIFLVGLLLAVFQWVIAIIGDLSNEKRLTEKNEEINSVKAAFYDTNDNRLQKITDSIEQLFARIDGISTQITNEKKLVKESPSKEGDTKKSKS